MQIYGDTIFDCTISLVWKSFSQQNVFEIIDKKPLQADALVGVDSYGDIFFVQENTLYKQLADGMYNFKDFQLGKIGQVDILNPLKIIVFIPMCKPWWCWIINFLKFSVSILL